MEIANSLSLAFTLDHITMQTRHTTIYALSVTGKQTKKQLGKEVSS